MNQSLTQLEKHKRKELLRKAVTDQFMQCLRSHGSGWHMPAVEALADHTTTYRPPRPVSIRIFDMKGDAEVRDPSSALRKAWEEYHSVCASFGEDWGRALITLILSPDRKKGQFQWNFSYPY